MNEKYFLCFNKDYFKNQKIFFITSAEFEGDYFYRRSLYLKSEKESQWKPCNMTFFERIFEIDYDFYLRITSLTKIKLSYINDCKDHIDLFKTWGVLDKIIENFI